MTQKTQSLERTLTLMPIVLFGLAYMTPLIVFGIYGVLADTTGGVVATAYLVALIAMLLQHIVMDKW